MITKLSRLCEMDTLAPKSPAPWHCPLPTPPIRSLLRHSSPSELLSDGGLCCRYVQNLFHPYPLETLLCYPPIVLADAMGLTHLYIKDDGRNPSGSFKDRASAIAVARARETGREVVATASTGNAAAALAAMGAAAAHATVIFVPRSAPQAKIAQLLVYGSQVLAVDGSYDDAFDLCVRACEEFGWYNRNTGFNPFMTEGKKTVSFEIAAQLSEPKDHPRPAESNGHCSPFASPDSVFVSVGDGSIIGGVYKGFREMHALGWIDRVPPYFRRAVHRQRRHS